MSVKIGFVPAIILVAACSEPVSPTATSKSYGEEDNFALHCAGWIEGHSKIGGVQSDLEASNYATELRWNGSEEGLTEVAQSGLAGEEGEELDYCTGTPGEKCSEKLEFGHLTAETSMSGPGETPDILVRTTSYVSVDLSNMKAVKRTKLLSASITEDWKIDEELIVISHEGKLDCEPA